MILVAKKKYIYIYVKTCCSWDLKLTRFLPASVPFARPLDWYEGVECRGLWAHVGFSRHLKKNWGWRFFSGKLHFTECVFTGVFGSFLLFDVIFCVRHFVYATEAEMCQFEPFLAGLCTFVWINVCVLSHYTEDQRRQMAFSGVLWTITR